MSTPDFSSVISGILSNPEMLSGIMNAVSTLSSTGLGSALQGNQNNDGISPPQKTDPAPPKNAEETQHRPQDNRPLGSYQGSSGDRRALLYALKPFLGEKRGEKIDFILKVLALLDAAEGFNKFK